MAIFHMSIKIITRGAGKSAVAAAAYRAGEKLTNERDGVTHDYTRKSGIFHSEILLPKNAPAEFADRSVLWNSVEKTERYKTAQLAREIEIALPRELSHDESISLVRRFVNEQFVEAGMCADLSFHDKDNGSNPHVHVMLTMRPINEDGSWGAKSRTVDGRKIPTVDWNERSKAEDWRKAWAAYCNPALTVKGAADRIDHCSYERQGLELIPTVHLGVAAMQMKRRGIETELVNRNREIAERNKQLKQMKARIRKLEDWAKAEREKPPTLWEVFSNISNREDGKTLTTSQHIANVKLMADTLNFIKKYDIETLDDMTSAVQNLRNRYNEIKLQNSKDARRVGVCLKNTSSTAKTTGSTAPFTTNGTR
jgi:ATP-dependent exoDNAse (exonuclease V) alpha subunit